MKKKYIIKIFIIAAVIQLLFPVSIILKREYILRKGREYRFRTEPVDPYDPFRGKYVAIRVKDTIKVSKKEEYEQGQKIYAAIKTNADGFAFFKNIALKKPEKGEYIKTRIKYAYKGKVRIRLPFDRYYMEEGKAARAEKEYRARTTSKKKDAYITVRVISGSAALVELYVEDMPIKKFLKGI